MTRAGVRMLEGLATAPDGALRYMLANIRDKGSRLYRAVAREQKRRRRNAMSASTLEAGPL